MNKADAKRFASYRADYARLFDTAEVRAEYVGAVVRTARAILENKPVYSAVSAETGVPWWVVGILHKMECDQFPRLTQHLHNGDSLRRRTWQVPRGRPVNGSPPFEWHESAVDAIRYDGLDKVGDWTLERTLFALEKFNGFGYRRRGINTPYLWSFTNQYSRGKFVRDGAFDADAVSQQSGAVALLVALLQLDKSISLRREADVPPVVGVDVDESERLARAVDKPVWRGRTAYGAVLAFFGATWVLLKDFASWIFDAAGDLGEVLGEVASTAESASGSAESILHMLGVASVYIGAAAVLYGVLVVLYARWSARQTGKIG